MNQRGAILLLTVLVIGALSGTIVTSLTLSGIDSAKLANQYSDSITNHYTNESCVEAALLKIKSDNIVGQETVIVEGNECSFEVINSGGENRTIQAITSLNNITKRHQVTLDSISPQLNITNWQEVESF
jgi:hypothetical protein